VPDQQNYHRLSSLFNQDIGFDALFQQPQKEGSPSNLGSKKGSMASFGRLHLNSDVIGKDKAI